MTTRFTRSQQKKLLQSHAQLPAGVAGVPCRNNGCKFYGRPEKLFLCSRCDAGEPVQRMNLVESAMREMGLCMGTPYDGYLLMQTSLRGRTAYEAAHLLAQAYREMCLQRGSMFLLSLDEGRTVIRAICKKYGADDPFYKASHVVARITCESWNISMHDVGGFHNSSLCYFGNMGEVPRDADITKKVLWQCKSVFDQGDGFGYPL